MLPLIKLLAAVALAWGLITVFERLAYRPPTKRRKR